MPMYKKMLYKKAYRLLENSTPLRVDCGRLCGSRCCSGDEDSGMHLLPEEEVMLSKADTFFNTRVEKLGSIDIYYTVCSGYCHRNERPLSCRIFPLAPYIEDDGSLSVIEDPRAKYICPLLAVSSNPVINRIFIRNVYYSFLTLMQDEDIMQYLLALTEVLKEYARFTGFKRLRIRRLIENI